MFEAPQAVDNIWRVLQCKSRFWVVRESTQWLMACRAWSASVIGPGVDMLCIVTS